MSTATGLELAHFGQSYVNQATHCTFIRNFHHSKSGNYLDFFAQPSAIDYSNQMQIENRSILDHSKASWQIDFSTSQIIRSSNHDSFFGYDENQAEWSAEIFFRHIHPDDSEKFSQSMKNAIASAKSFEHIFKVVWQDNSVHTLRSWGYMECDPISGVPTRLIGFTEFAPRVDVVPYRDKNLF